MEYLIKNKVIYRRDPISDEPTTIYDWGKYYSDGTRQCYTLFNSKAKINTYKSLKWHLYVLWYLNPEMDLKSFKKITQHICLKSNNFVTFTVSDNLLQKMIDDVFVMDLEKPPPNKIRKIIFKDSSGLSIKEKLSIVGKIIGRSKISNEEIYEAMLMLSDNNIKITVSKIATYLKCSTRTVYRNMSDDLKREKELLNKQNEKI